MKKSLGKTCFYSLIIILAAQLSMNLFIANFKISVAIICLPVFLFLLDSFPLIPVTFFSAVGVFALRTLIYWFGQGDISGTAASYLPEAVFYICYGLLLYVYSKLLRNRSTQNALTLLPLILIDYSANLSELFIRIQEDAFHAKAQAGLILVALLRTAVIWCILAILEQYRLFVTKKEHEERYQRLLLLISKLNGEVVWMQKNTALIEDTMSVSYRLFENLKASGTDSELTASALSVAKDIHEIKKEYLLIMRGISEALDEELQSDGMYLEEMLLLLKDAMALAAKEQNKTLIMTISCTVNPYTRLHYALMSIFRNLFINALEASEDPHVRIEVSGQSSEDSYRFTVTDHGPGIDPEYLEEVFKTGFSTKINYTTGEINRGLGLNLVQDLVEHTFNGHIFLASHPGSTTFTIQIPKDKLEGNTQ